MHTYLWQYSYSTIKPHQPCGSNPVLFPHSKYEYKKKKMSHTFLIISGHKLQFINLKPLFDTLQLGYILIFISLIGCV